MAKFHTLHTYTPTQLTTLHNSAMLGPSPRPNFLMHHGFVMLISPAQSSVSRAVADDHGAGAIGGAGQGAAGLHGDREPEGGDPGRHIQAH